MPTPASSCATGCWRCVDAGGVRAKPSEMFRAFEVAIERDLPLGLQTADLISEHAAHAGEALRRDPESARPLPGGPHRSARQGHPLSPRADERPGAAGRAHAGVGADHGSRAARPLSRLHRRPALALRGGHAQGAAPRGEQVRTAPWPSEEMALVDAAAAALPGDAAARRGQGAGQEPLGQGGGGGPGHRHPPGPADGRRQAGRVPGPRAPDHGPHLAAARPGGPGPDRPLRPAVRRHRDAARAVPHHLRRPDLRRAGQPHRAGRTSCCAICSSGPGSTWSGGPTC